MWLVYLDFMRRLSICPAGVSTDFYNDFKAPPAVAAIFSLQKTGSAMSDDDLRIRPGKGRRQGTVTGRSACTLVGQIKRATARSGLGLQRNRTGRRGGTSHSGRGRRAALRAGHYRGHRRVVVKARIIRSAGRHSAAPLARHITYLGRDGVTREGGDAQLFDAGSDKIDGDAFANRCRDDRHHFRFIVSPEDATELEDIRIFTRELMGDAARDLGTRLDWVAVDHWNTDNPHVHILLRGKADDGENLVIDKDYIRSGMRARAEERATLELGPRSEREIGVALKREVDAERWTSLDRDLQHLADEKGGFADLRPGRNDAASRRRSLLVGRAMKLETLGLAEKVGPACWTLTTGLETRLRDLGIHGDIIKTMHRAMESQGYAPDLAGFALHGDQIAGPVVGRLIERGLHDELTGTAYAVINGADGRTHHLKFSELEMTGDAKPGAIVELRAWEDSKGRERRSLATRSDLPLEKQVTAKGATWIDRQLVARDPIATAGGFGGDIREAMAERAVHLESEGLAKRQGQRFVFARNLLATLKARELDDAVARIAEQTGLVHQPSKPGEQLAGIYRERVTLASRRFAMLDNGMEFELVPWRPSLDKHLGQTVNGRMKQGGGIEWTLGRNKGLSI